MIARLERLRDPKTRAWVHANVCPHCLSVYTIPDPERPQWRRARRARRGLERAGQQRLFR